MGQERVTNPQERLPGRLYPSQRCILISDIYGSTPPGDPTTSGEERCVTTLKTAVQQTTRHRKNSWKTARYCRHRRLFRFYCSSSIWRYRRRYRQREKRCWKITCSSTLWFKRSHSRYLILTNFRDTYRITPLYQLTLGPLYSCTPGYTC